MDRYFIRDLRTYVFKMNWRNYFWSFCIDNMWRLFKSQKGGQNEILNHLVVLFKRIYFCRFEWHFTKPWRKQPDIFFCWNYHYVFFESLFLFPSQSDTSKPWWFMRIPFKTCSSLSSQRRIVMQSPKKSAKISWNRFSKFFFCNLSKTHWLTQRLKSMFF